MMEFQYHVQIKVDDGPNGWYTFAGFRSDASANEYRDHLSAEGSVTRVINAQELEEPDTDESDALCPCGDVDCSRPWGHPESY